jgi:UDP-glucose 4-epimerase
VINKMWGDRVSNILITGACGYVGSALAAALVNKGHKVRSMDVIDPITPINGVEYIKGSIDDEEAISKVLKNVDFVYHNAVYVPFFSNREKMYDININGLEKLLEGCLYNSIKKVIITSSSCIFGNKAEMPIKHDCVPKPTDMYGNIRLLAEGVASTYISKGLNIITFRPHLIASAGREGIFTMIFDKIVNNKDLWLPSSIRHPHQFIHINDFIDALYSALEYSQSETFNIGSETRFTLEQLIMESIKKANSTSKVKIIPNLILKSSELIDKLFGCSIFGSHRILTAENGFVFDCSYVKEKLNWKPTYSDYDTWFDCFDWFYKSERNGS